MKKFLILVLGVVLISSSIPVSAKKKVDYKGTYEKTVIYDRDSLSFVDSDGEFFECDYPVKDGTIMTVEFDGRGTQDRHDDIPGLIVDIYGTAK